MKGPAEEGEDEGREGQLEVWEENPESENPKSFREDSKGNN